MAASKVPVTITFRRPGTSPPVFVAGTFSEPQWQPQEMTSSSDGQGEYEFKAELLAAPGSSIQYKFRVGHGDWWLLDENADSVTDHEGNCNSVLTVPNEIRPELEEAPTPESSPPAPASPPPNDNEPAPEIRLLDDDVKEGASSAFGDFETASGWLDPFPKKHGPQMEGDWDDNQERVPLFAHECLVPNDLDSNEGGSRPHSPSEARHSLGFEHEPDVSELQDPELEQFPSRLEQISELIHEVEGELEEDETAFEGVPPSAVLGVPRRKTNDFVGDFIGGSPVESPSLSRPQKRLSVPRQSVGSVTSDMSSSVLSLQSIAESGEDNDDQDPPLSPQPVMVPSPVTRPTMAGKIPSSEDDEAVVLDSPKRTLAEAPTPVQPQSAEETSAAPSSEASYRDLPKQSEKAQSAEKTSAAPASETPYRDLPRHSEKAQPADPIDHDREYQTSTAKKGEIDLSGVPALTDMKEKGDIGGSLLRSKPAAGTKTDRQTLLAVGSAAVAMLGLALWWKSRI
ncbi:hypothetical protein RB594_005427 [Gaeumannomyces avenae]